MDLNEGETLSRMRDLLSRTIIVLLILFLLELCWVWSVTTPQRHRQPHRLPPPVYYQEEGEVPQKEYTLPPPLRKKE